MNATGDTKLTTLITELFPPEVAVCAAVHMPESACLLPAEQDGTGDMVASRLREFTLGRHCARQALQTLGLPPSAIPRAKDRSPIWPEGITGTISHSGDVAAAVVSNASEFIGLGLDIESANPLEDDIAKLVCRNDEKSDGLNAKLLFCIKEAIYKAIYPSIGMYVDFQEMEVCFSEDGKSYTAISHSQNFDSAVVRKLRGRYFRNEDFVICSAWLPA